jgi:SAM-dependent methyltransferase
VSAPPAPGWWTTFFEGAALELWRRAIPADVSRGQAADIARVLRLRGGERVLDVPCGNGRLALELAARGQRVSGLDQALEFVDEARRSAAERGLELELVVGDMRALPWADELDAAFCVGNSYGYLDDAGNRAFLAGVASALRRGGRFLLEYPLVAELALARRTYRDWHLLGDRLLLSDGHYDPVAGRLETAYTFIDLSRPDEAESRTASYAVYTAREVGRSLSEAGFASVELLGDLDDGSPFDARSSAFHALAIR